MLPQPLFVTKADLHFPSNRAAPIAADLDISDMDGLPIRAEFDFRQTGPQSWDIRFDTTEGPVTLSLGGAKLFDGDTLVVDAKDAEYQGLYRRFVDLTSRARSDVDLAPQLLVADAFTLGQRHVVDAFEHKAEVKA